MDAKKDMIKILVLADDFTGALDSGVKFSAMGVDTQIIPNADDFHEGDLYGGAQVLVINTATRHLTAKCAYDMIYDIVRRASQLKISCIFKKTDSALRGNVGAELSAVLDASGEKVLSFIPAFPELGRTTRGGIQYFEGVPIRESRLGRDLFNPIFSSRVSRVIRQQTDIPVAEIPLGESWSGVGGGKTIVVYDNETDEEMEETVRRIRRTCGLALMAGCGGLASILPSVLGLGVRVTRIPRLSQNFFFLCGSINPVTRAQLAYAQKNGFSVTELSLEQSIDPSFPDSEACVAMVERLRRQDREGKPLALCSSPIVDEKQIPQELLRHSGDIHQRRVQASRNLSAVLKRLVEQGLERTLMFSGGDLLYEFFSQINCGSLRPMGEIAQGAVVSEFCHGGKRYQMISKSGGFGTQTLLVDILPPQFKVGR